jgi:hypothetical protein
VFPTFAEGAWPLSIQWDLQDANSRFGTFAPDSVPKGIERWFSIELI